MFNKILNKIFSEAVSTKLKISFALIVGMSLLIGIFSAVNILQLSTLIEKIYKHPFIVSNTVRDINFDIVDMHRTMKDVTLSKNITEFNDAVQKVDTLEKNVIKNFKIVSEHFLGDKNRVEEKYQLFINWRIIRKEIIDLVEKEKADEAAEITKNRGAKYVQNLNDQMKLLIDFANNKANQLFTDAQEEKNYTIFLIIIYIILVLPLSIYIAKEMINNITIQIKRVTKGLDSFFSLIQGKNEIIEPIIYEHNDEFGEIISSVNKNIAYSAKLYSDKKNKNKS